MDGNASRHWVGVGLVLLSALGFSGTTIAAVFAYDAGANPLAVITIRFVGAIVLLALLLRLTGAALRLPPRERAISLGLGLFLGAQSYFLYSSFELIPVGLTMVIFYVYPLMVGVIESITGRERMTPALWVALSLAFVGLLLVFNVSGEGLDTLGVIHAVLAGLSWGALTLVSARVIRSDDSRPITLHMQLSAAAAYGVICLVTGDAKLPGTATGWTAFLLMPVFYVVAVTAFFAAVGVIGSIRAALFMNFEPVSTIFFGFVILGQALAPLQLAGAALVVAAIVGVRWDGRRRAIAD